MCCFCFFLKAEEGIRYHCVTGLQRCALPISKLQRTAVIDQLRRSLEVGGRRNIAFAEYNINGEIGVQTCALPIRSEEHTSELQSHSDLVCRLLLEKKKKTARQEDVFTC